VRLAAPDEETKAAIDEETLTDAERLRVVHHLITSPEREGGAGVTPGLDGWNYVESIFPLHDSKFNRVYFLTQTGLTSRNGFNLGRGNGLSRIRNWILCEIISARNSLFISLIRNITFSLLSRSPFSDSSHTSFYLRTTCYTRFVLWSGQLDSNIPGREGNVICL
jgi:hypothetical protein